MIVPAHCDDSRRRRMIRVTSIAYSSLDCPRSVNNDRVNRVDYSLFDVIKTYTIDLRRVMFVSDD